MSTPRYNPPPSFVGVALTATTGIIGTVTPGLAAQGGGLLAQAVAPCDSIPRAPKGQAFSRRPHVARGLDLGRRLAAAIIERPVAPALVMVQDPREHVARTDARAVQLLDFAGVTAAAQTLIVLLDEAGAVERLVETPLVDFATERFNDGACDAAGRFWAGGEPVRPQTYVRQRTDQISRHRLQVDAAAHGLGLDSG